MLRLAFHDCVTRDGAEGGSNDSVRFELDWRENRHLDVAISALDPIHQSVGSDLSYADLIVLAGAGAVAAAGAQRFDARIRYRSYRCIEAGHALFALRLLVAVIHAHPLQLSAARAYLRFAGARPLD